jgi:integrase
MSTATHSAVDRDLRLGVPPQNVFSRLLGRPPTASEIASLALAPSTASKLRGLELALSLVATPLNLHYLHPTVVLNHITSLLDAGWKFGSTLTITRNILMMATRIDFRPLMDSPVIADLKRGLCRLAALEPTKQAPVLSFQDLTSLVQLLLQRKEWQLAAFMALAWLLAGRLGEIALIPLTHFFPLELPVRVKFSVMKGVYGAQEKSLPPGPLCQVVTYWHYLRSSEWPVPKKFFSITPTQAIACLKEDVNPLLSGHSIRRGALTHGDLGGGSSQDLMTLSSHKSPQMLQRYIGRASSERRDAMLRVGSILAQPCL